MARASTSSTWLTGTISSNSFTVVGISARSFSFSNGMSTVRIPLLLEASDRKNPAAQRDLARHGNVAPDRDSGQRRDHRGDHADASRRAILRHSAFRQVDVDFLAGENRRLHAISRSARFDEAHRGLDRLLHHLAKLARGLDLPLARNRDRLDRQQLAADFRPRETRDGADLVFLLTNAVAIAADAEESLEIVLANDDAFVLALENLAERLAGDLRQLALQRADSGLTRVESQDRAQRIVGEFELAVLQAVGFHLLRDQVAPGDLDLLVLGIALERMISIRSMSGCGISSEFAVVTNITSLRS